MAKLDAKSVQDVLRKVREAVTQRIDKEYRLVYESIDWKEEEKKACIEEQKESRKC